jgi:hypothetical protein
MRTRMQIRFPCGSRRSTEEIAAFEHGTRLAYFPKPQSEMRIISLLVNLT